MLPALTDELAVVGNRKSRPSLHGRRRRHDVGPARLGSIPLPGISSPRAKVSARQPGPSGLIFGLIHLRSPAFIGVRIAVLAQIADVNGIWRTIILTPENRKVGGSTMPLVAALASVNMWCFLSFITRSPGMISDQPGHPVPRGYLQRVGGGCFRSRRVSALPRFFILPGESWRHRVPEERIVTRRASWLLSARLSCLQSVPDARSVSKVTDKGRPALARSDRSARVE
jgi:hypothetical protein